MEYDSEGWQGEDQGQTPTKTPGCSSLSLSLLTYKAGTRPDLTELLGRLNSHKAPAD